MSTYKSLCNDIGRKSYTTKHRLQYTRFQAYGRNSSAGGVVTSSERVSESIPLRIQMNECPTCYTDEAPVQPPR